MKKKVLALLAVALLILSASAAWAAPTINIIEPPNDTLHPDVSSTGFLAPLNMSLSPEYAYVTGTLLGVTPVNYISPATYGIKMLEPAFEGGGVSDFAILLINNPSFIPFGSQAFSLTFLSDGFAGFIPSYVPIIGVGGDTTFADALEDFDAAVSTGSIREFPSILEDGTLQNLFTFTAASGLIVNAQSDVVPIPGSAILFGTGLLGLIPAWRLRRKA